ncbi:MAG: hypothetical protein ABIO02_03680 [Patescibacteria group bacterium]
MVAENKLKLFLILAPPRTASTMCENSIAANPCISFNVHEPFVRLGYYEEDEESGYKTIFDIYQKIRLTNKKKPISLIIKEMPHWIAPKKAYIRIFSLIKTPLIFIIRNPLLSTESRMRKVLQTVIFRENVSIIKYLISFYVKKKRYESIQDMFLSYTNESSGKFSNVLLSQDDIDLLKMLTSTNFRIDKDLYPALLQQKLFDCYAQIKGYDNWQILLDHILKEKDYIICEDILLIEKVFILKNSDWEALAEQVDLLEKKNKQFTIIDSTELRIAPEFMIKSICDILNIRFSKRMLAWKNTFDDLHINQKRPHHRLWYDTFLKSNEVEFPFEIPLPLKKFPNFIKKQIIEIDFPIYIKLFNKPQHIKSSNTILSINLKSKNMESKSISIVDIDPVFSAVKESKMLIDKAFLEKNSLYGDEFNLIKEYSV